MKQILCFGDSNTYGYIPITGKRQPWEKRWTGILNEKLGLNEYRIHEEGLVGRTTIFDDPLREGRNGVKSFHNILETHTPLNLIIIMLGTNDCKKVYSANANVIGKGITKLINQAKTYSPESKILLISPIYLGEGVWEDGFDPEFSRSSVETSKQLKKEYENISRQNDIYFLAASDYAEPSEGDREHMNEDGHRNFANAVYSKVKEILG